MSKTIEEAVKAKSILEEWIALKIKNYEEKYGLIVKSVAVKEESVEVEIGFE